MNRVLNLVLVLPLLLVLSTDAFAQSRRRSTYSDSTYSSPTTSSSSGSYSGGGNAGRMAVSGVFGFLGNNGAVYASGTSTGGPRLSGFFGFGGDFDYYMSDDMSIGGLLRYYTTSDTVNSVEYTDTLLTLGGTLKAHVIETTNWSGHVTTGLGLLNATAKAGNTTVDPGSTFGFYFGVAMLYKISHNLAVGVENMRMLALGDKVNGWPLSDYMFKARFFF